jgi:glyoxylase-like metal-dependent hydrolase (beta-lactamase superfamily II)
MARASAQLAAGRRALLVAAALATGACLGQGARVPEAEAVRPAPFELDYAGTADVEGDFSKPGERRTVATTLRALASGADRLLVEQRTWIDGGDSPPRGETTLVRGERVWRTASAGGAGSGLVELVGAAAAEARRFAELPWRAPSPISGGSGDSDVRREQWRAHPRIGDVLETTHFSEVHFVEGRPIAKRIAFERFGDFDAQRAELVLEQAKAAPGVAREFDPPADTAGSSAGAPARAAAVRVEPVAPGVLLVDDPASAVRSLAVEFADHLVVLEAPQDSATGERIVDALAAARPGKPIRTVLFSHHHARFCGGLRAFIAAGASIATTPDVTPFVESAVTRPFTLAPDRLARRGGRLRFETFDAGRRFADGEVELDVLPLGAAAGHSDDYLVFWLPRARLLFVGDLAWSGFEGGAPRATKSGPALADFIAARELDVATVLQALRVEGGPSAVPYADWLRALPPAGRN